MRLAVFVRYAFVLSLSLILIACGGGGSSGGAGGGGNIGSGSIGEIGNGDNSSDVINTGNDANSGNVNNEPLPPDVAMVSSNADLSSAQRLGGATITGTVYMFFPGGAEWETRGVTRVVFYCCKGGADQHTVYPAVTAPPYTISVDLSQYQPGVVYELYADVFFVNQYAPEPMLVNFTVGSANTPPSNNPPGTANSPPTITGVPNTAISANSAYNFTPNANDADGDPLIFSISNLPGWANFNSSSGSLRGTPSNADIGTYSDIVISVSDGAETISLAAFNIEVTPPPTPGSASLSWTPPTEYTNNEPLTNLAGYNIYYGTTAGYYPNQISLNNSGLTEYVVDNLPGNTTYFFVMTALDNQGKESGYSNVVIRNIP